MKLMSRVTARSIAVSAARLGQFASASSCIEANLCIQLDSIAKVARAHQMTIAARTTQTYEEVDSELWGAGPAKVFEYPVHAASLVSVKDWPLMVDVMHRAAASNKDWAPSAVTARFILDQLHDRGPLTQRDLGLPSVKSGGWNWGTSREAVEYMLWAGQIVCSRRNSWRRVYDLPERALGHLYDSIVPSPDDAAAERVSRVVGAMGIATPTDIAEYLRTSISRVRVALQRTSLVPVKVEGWDEEAFVAGGLDCDAAAPAIDAVLSPFDNLIWDRKRTNRLFGFDYTFEAYKRPSQRVFGYYVLPILVDGDLVARADLDVSGRTLRVLNLVREPSLAEGDDRIEEVLLEVARRRGLDEVQYHRD